MTVRHIYTPFYEKKLKLEVTNMGIWESVIVKEFKMGMSVQEIADLHHWQKQDVQRIIDYYVVLGKK